MKEITAEEFLDNKRKVEAKYKRWYTADKKLWAEGKKPKHYLKSQYITSGNFEYCDTPKQMRSMLDEFDKNIDALGLHFDGNFMVMLDAYGGDYGASVDDNHYKYSYKVFAEKEDHLQGQMSTEIKDFIRLALKPKSVSYTQQVDCKLLQLFVEGAIDFKTLQKLVYTNCEL